jgi:general secretion pathway protein K
LWRAPVSLWRNTVINRSTFASTMRAMRTRAFVLLRTVTKTLAPGNPHPRRKREEGFALLLTIWVLVLIALLAASLAAQTESETRVAHNRAELAVARELADAGVALGLNGLLDRVVSQRWPADGRARSVLYGDGSIEIRIQDEAGKLDLNTAPIELIVGLLRVQAVDGAQAANITSAVLARRQQYAASVAEAQVAANEGEAPLAQAVRLPFATVSELRLVASLPQSTFERMRPFVTVYSNSARVNLLTAPAPVLLALPGVRPDEILAYVAARGMLSPGQTDQDLPQVAGLNKFAENGELHAVTITAVAATRGGARFAREAVYELALERPLNPYTLLQWLQAPESAAQ